MKTFRTGERGVVPFAVLGLVALFIVIGSIARFQQPLENIGTENPSLAKDTLSPVMPSARDAKKENLPAPERGATSVPSAPAKSAKASQPPVYKEESAAKDGNARVNEWFDERSFGGGNSSTQQRPGWEILSEAERAILPDCKSPLMTVSPVPLDSIEMIEPLGSANPPEHTLASISSDPYIAVKGRGTTTLTPLVAPGDLWIIAITPRYGVTQDPEDHVIKYAFCKDVYGVVDHVKSFSDEMKRLVDAYVCPNPKNKPGDNECPVQILEKVAAGTPLGTVGRMQGNFNFGTWDLRVTHSFISPWRHGHLTKHATCPFDYFASPLKEQLLSKLEPAANGNCGTVEHDVAGTLQGDWFIGDATPTRPSDWGKLLHFGSSNLFAGQSVISISGTFVPQPTKWIFTPVDSGTINRKFSDVVSGAVYCYDNDGNHRHRVYERGVTNGRILVELTSATELQIEYQQGMCQGGSWEFKNPTRYQR